MNNTTQPRFQQNQNSQRNRNSDFKQYLSFDKKFGYLHEVREIQTKQSKTYTARISVPMGQGDNMHYVNFELYIKSADALIAFLSHQKSVNDENTKVTVRFSCNNTHPRAYVAQNGERKGQAIPYLGGNLSYLHTMKIDGVVVHGYTQENNEDETPGDVINGDVIDKETGEIINDKRSVSNDDFTDGDVIPLHSEHESRDANLSETPPAEAYDNELESVLLKDDMNMNTLSNEVSTSLPNIEADEKKHLNEGKKRSTPKRGRNKSVSSTTA